MSEEENNFPLLPITFQQHIGDLYHKIWGGAPTKVGKLLELFLRRIVLVRGKPKSFQSLLFVKTQHLILEKFPSET